MVDVATYLYQKLKLSVINFDFVMECFN